MLICHLHLFIDASGCCGVMPEELSALMTHYSLAGKLLNWPESFWTPFMKRMQVNLQTPMRGNSKLCFVVVNRGQHRKHLMLAMIVRVCHGILFTGCIVADQSE